MMPLGDDNSQEKSVPIVTYAIIAVNILVFLLELGGGDSFIENWSFIPSRFLAHPVSNFITIFTAMFMHAGFAHIAGNMLYLWIFGDNVEDRFGKIPYLLFYLFCGVAATFAQLFMDPSSSVPNLGASGAIAGVLGAYILLFPQEKVNVMLGRSIVALPSLIVIGFWFVLQFFSGISSAYSSAEGSGGVAYMAHVGGFICGLIIAGFFRGIKGSTT